MSRSDGSSIGAQSENAGMSPSVDVSLVCSKYGNLISALAFFDNYQHVAYASSAAGRSRFFFLHNLVFVVYSMTSMSD